VTEVPHEATLPAGSSLASRRNPSPAHVGRRQPQGHRVRAEDFSKIPDAAGVPYTYWGLGYTDRDTYLAAEKDGHLDDLTSNHSPKFLPPMQPCLRTGTEALVAAALAWLTP
jgi:hippurate hydrolase